MWAPFYDFVATLPFRKERRRALKLLGLRQDEAVVLIGVGTGLDLPLLGDAKAKVGVDLSLPMLRNACSRTTSPASPFRAIVGDARALPFADGSFDAAVLTLILSVAPEPTVCLSEALRVLKPGGRVVIFDKFLPDGHEPGRLRRAVNGILNFFGTDITRRFGDLVADVSCTIEHDEPGPFRGAFRTLLLRKA